MLMSSEKQGGITPPKTNMTLENPHLKMYFPLNMGIFQCDVNFQVCHGLLNARCHPLPRVACVHSPEEQPSAEFGKSRQVEGDQVCEPFASHEK